MEKRDKKAIKIQSFIRKYNARKNYIIQIKASKLLQSTWRITLEKRNLALNILNATRKTNEENILRNNSATRITSLFKNILKKKMKNVLLVKLRVAAVSSIQR